MKCTAVIALTLGLLLAGLMQGPVRGDDSSSPVAKKRLVELINQLGATSFKEREDAAAGLLQFGEQARTVLVDALESSDLEVRMRAQNLLLTLSQVDLNRQLAAFLKDVDGKQQHQLPGWPRFQDVVGSDQAARNLFADMVRSDAALLKAFDQKSVDAKKLYDDRIQTLQVNAIPGLPQSIPPSSLAALLLVGSHPDVATSTTVGYQMYSLLNQSFAAQALTQGPRSPLMKRLFTAWLKGCAGNDSLARNGLMLTMRHTMKEEGLEFARSLLARKRSSNYCLPYAVLTIGRFGTKSDVKSLEALLQNSAVCHTWHNGKLPNVIKIQVRDVALATMIHLTGQDHKDYGFEYLRKYQMTLFHVYTCGFSEEKKRQAAFAKWQKWTSEQNSS